MNVNLMSANITAGAATSAADLLTDLKSGYLLGANPRKQFLGPVRGHFFRDDCHRLLFPHHGALGSRAGRQSFPLPPQ